MQREQKACRREDTGCAECLSGGRTQDVSGERPAGAVPVKQIGGSPCFREIVNAGSWRIRPLSYNHSRAPLEPCSAGHKL